MKVLMINVPPSVERRAASVAVMHPDYRSADKVLEAAAARGYLRALEEIERELQDELELRRRAAETMASRPRPAGRRRKAVG